MADSLFQRILASSTALATRNNRKVEYEYLPGGFTQAACDPKIKGWNLESIVNVYRWNWEMFGEIVAGRGPLGYSPECGLPVNDDISFQNTILIFAYSLALSTRATPSIKFLDWGGGMGHYYKIAKSLVPDVHIDYHCKDVELLAAAGSQATLDGHFYADESCLEQTYDFILVSAALHYTEDWKALIHKLATSLSGYILITRLPVTTQSPSYVYVQRPYNQGYDTENVSWCIEQDEFLQCCVEAGLEVVREFVIAEKPDILNAPGICQFKAFLLTNKPTSIEPLPSKASVSSSTPCEEMLTQSVATDSALLEGHKHFCTLFDKFYLLRGLALHESLTQHCKDFTLWILCLDDQTHELLNKLKLRHVKLISLPEFERANPDLVAVKSKRSTLEYYFTCTPVLIKHVIKQIGMRTIVTYLDADLYFYGDPQPLFDELHSGSTLIMAHDFPEHLKKSEIYGKYNVGLLTIVNDRSGLDCLEWWRQKCLEWCFDKLEYERYADQKYLDQFQTRFSRVVVSQHKGTGIAPWNWTSCSIDQSTQKIVRSGQPMIFFHFHKFKLLNSWVCDPCTLSEEYGMPSFAIRQQICQPYIRCLKKCFKLVRHVDNTFRLEDEIKDLKPSNLSIIQNILSGRYLFSQS